MAGDLSIRWVEADENPLLALTGNGKHDHAFRPFAEQALRGNQAIAPQRRNSASGAMTSLSKISALVLLLFWPAFSKATVDISPAWESVDFRAGKYRVQAKVVGARDELGVLKLWISGQRCVLDSAEYTHISNPVLERITVTTVLRGKGTSEPESYYLSIPFLVKESEDPGNGRLVDGGVWVLHFEGNRFVERDFEAPQLDSR